MNPILHVLLIIFTFMRKLTGYSYFSKSMGWCCGDARHQGRQLCSLSTMYMNSMSN